MFNFSVLCTLWMLELYRLLGEFYVVGNGELCQGHKWNIRMVRRGKWKENPVDQDEKSFKE